VTELLIRLGRQLARLAAVRQLVTTWRGRFILAFLAAQLLIPLDYYVRRRDPHDERFAWRMFSPMRMTKCRPSFTVDGAPVELDAEFHEAWITAAKRGRASVIEAMAQRLCGKHPGKPVVVKLECEYFDRPAATYGPADLCTRPLL
jgi:hypothetical protein